MRLLCQQERLSPFAFLQLSVLVNVDRNHTRCVQTISNGDRTVTQPFSGHRGNRQSTWCTTQMKATGLSTRMPQINMREVLPSVSHTSLTAFLVLARSPLTIVKSMTGEGAPQWQDDDQELLPVLSTVRIPHIIFSNPVPSMQPYC